jgi:putative methyltransferase (TIGR04325 family)
MRKNINKLIIEYLKQRRSFDDRISTWQEAKNVTSGYESEDILKKVTETYLQSQQTPGSYERDSVLLSDGLVNWPLVAMIYWCSVQVSEKIRLLDLGGSLASQYFQHKRFLKNIDIKWAVVEQKNYVIASKNIINDQYLVFYDQLSSCIAKEQPNFALLGSSLQYLEDPYSVLKELSSHDLKVLIIDRTPMHKGSKDFVVTQKVPEDIYNASYPAWIFSEENLIKSTADYWVLVNTFDSIGGQQKTTKGIKFKWRSHVYIKKELLQT